MQKAFRTPKRQDQKTTSPRYIIIKSLDKQNKERILNYAKDKFHVTHKGKSIRITADFSVETLKARKACNVVFQALKENDYPSRLLYPVKLLFIIEGK
jgi:hypothetical protein